MSLGIVQQAPLTIEIEFVVKSLEAETKQHRSARLVVLGLL